jgi:nitrite reductase/ring-hydroxylating ferredoxin subunit
MSRSLELIDAGAVNEGEGKTVRRNERAFAVFRHAGEIYVTDDECPHVGASLANGWVEDGQVACAFHGWTFDLKTGACLTCPGRPVRTYPVRIENGAVHIEIEDI